MSEARSALATLADRVEPMEGAVRLELDGPLARLWIDNPGARNALTVGMMVQLADAVIELADWDGAALILAAATPGVFCSGGHLRQVVRAVDCPDRAEAMATAMGRVLDALLELPLVSVSALSGPAIGGGAELCTATDFRVASPAARIHFVHASLGIAPGWGGTRRLVRHLGRTTALRLLAASDPIEVDAGLDTGLVTATADDAVGAAESLLERALSRTPAAVRAIKWQVVAAEHEDPAADARAFADVWGGPAHIAALQRFRTPPK